MSSFIALYIIKESGLEGKGNFKTFMIPIVFIWRITFSNGARKISGSLNFLKILAKTAYEYSL